MAKRRWIIVGAVVASAAGFALWPRGSRLGVYAAPNLGPSHGTTTIAPPPLSTYTSSPLTAYGQEVRYEIKIPPGWKVTVPARDHYVGLGIAGADGATYWPLSAEAPFSGEMDGKIVVSHDERQKGVWLPNATAHYWTKHPHGYSAEGEVRQEGRVYKVESYHGDRAYFDATYRQICESFRVIREK